MADQVTNKYTYLYMLVCVWERSFYLHMEWNMELQHHAGSTHTGQWFLQLVLTAQSEHSPPEWYWAVSFFKISQDQFKDLMEAKTTTERSFSKLNTNISLQQSKPTSAIVRGRDTLSVWESLELEDTGMDQEMVTTFLGKVKTIIYLCWKHQTHYPTFSKVGLVFKSETRWSSYCYILLISTNKV